MDSADVKKSNLAQTFKSEIQPTRRRDLAAEAGLSRAVYFKEDTWIVGDKRYTAPRYKVPSELKALYQPSSGPEKTDKELEKTNSYNRAKFTVESLWTTEEPRTTVTIYGRPDLTERSPETPAHATLYLDIEHGFTIFFGLPEKGLFPFTVNEFCDALSVARWTLVLDVASDEKGQAMYGKTAETDSASEKEYSSSSEDEAKPPSPSASPAPKR